MKTPHLKKLRKRIAGLKGPSLDVDQIIRQLLQPMMFGTYDYTASLDAVFALRDAVLPGWCFARLNEPIGKYPAYAELETFNPNNGVMGTITQWGRHSHPTSLVLAALLAVIDGVIAKERP